MVGVLFFSAVLQLLFSGGGVIVAGSDVNWGKKVSCFVVDGTIVCPGCNYRAGLSCPRKLKDSQNCLLPPSTQPPPKTKPTTPSEATSEEEVVTNATAGTPVLRFDSTTTETNEIQKEPTKTPIDMNIYLYRIFGSKLPSYHRYQRDIAQKEEEEEEPEICNWNGDCPCPLICCKTGPGCPKRCVMGIRLPPPWG